jgi:hypothetical protein
MKATTPEGTPFTIERELKALLLESDWISATVLLDQGADVYTLTYQPKEVDVLFKSPRT